MKNNATDNLQACGSVVLVMRAAAENEKSQAETSIVFFESQSKHLFLLYQRWAMANVIIHNVPYYPGTTGNNSAIRTPPRVTFDKLKGLFQISRAAFVSTADGTGCHQLQQSGLLMCIKKATRLGFFPVSEFGQYKAEVMAMIHDEQCSSASDDE